MKSAVIFEGKNYRLTSWGNGLMYVLTNLETEKDIFFQGDAATEFREAWEDIEKGKPDEPTDEIMNYFWCMYS